MTSIEAKELVQFSLNNLQYDNKPFHLNPGDVLQLTLTVANAEAIDPPSITLKVDIVTEPVTPVPQSAFALLRWHPHDPRQVVECVRFAWGPPASRIELICPDDLRTEVVRRRAVYQWMDSVRPTNLGGYAVQKIAPNGATHFPGSVRSELM